MAKMVQETVRPRSNDTGSNLMNVLVRAFMKKKMSKGKKGAKADGSEAAKSAVISSLIKSL